MDTAKPVEEKSTSSWVNLAVVTIILIVVFVIFIQFYSERCDLNNADPTDPTKTVAEIYKNSHINRLIITSMVAYVMAALAMLIFVGIKRTINIATAIYLLAGAVFLWAVLSIACQMSMVTIQLATNSPTDFIDIIVKIENIMIIVVVAAIIAFVTLCVQRVESVKSVNMQLEIVKNKTEPIAKTLEQSAQQSAQSSDILEGNGRNHHGLGSGRTALLSGVKTAFLAEIQ